MSRSQLEDSIFGEADHLDPRGRTERRRQRRRRRGGHLRRWLTLLVAVAVVGGGGYLALGVVKPIYANLTASKDYPGPGSGSVTVVVAPGDSGRAIGQTLAKADVVKTAGAFVDAAGADTDAAGRIQPGTYTLKKQMTATDALAALTDARNRTVPRVTLPEGLWLSEVYARLSTATGVPVEDYRAAAKDPASLGLPAVARGNLEGYLFPSTYEFPDKASAATQLKMMVKKSVDELTKAGVQPADMQQVMIVASIVEGEARGAADRAKVARVIENRLSTPTGPTVGLLQMDSTVNYALQKRGNLTSAQFQAAKTNPYDTYSHKGLPPGPINSPGAAAIAAAAQPAAGPWFYFVTVNLDSGETKFATTQAEHDRYVAELDTWCTANKGKCSGTG